MQPSKSGDIEIELDITKKAPQVDKNTNYSIEARYLDGGGNNTGFTIFTTLEVKDTDRNQQQNQPPTADFTVTPQSPTINQQVTFNATSSIDQDGQITQYR